MFVKYFATAHLDREYEECFRELIHILYTKDLKEKFFTVKMLICVNPFKYLGKNLDFGLFYEAEDEEL